MRNRSRPVRFSFRAWQWLHATVPDPLTRQAIDEEHLIEKEPWLNGHRMHFTLTRLQAQASIRHLQELEEQRQTRNLPRIGLKHDKVIFTNAIEDIREAFPDI